MKKSHATHPELLQDMKHINVQQTGIESARRQLVTKGWERYDVDAALWHRGFKDWGNRYLARQLKIFGVGLFVVLGLVVIVGGSIYMDRNYKQNGMDTEDASQQVDVGSLGGTIQSEAVGIELTFPKDWELVSKPDGTPGLYAWQIEPISNRAARENMAKEYQQQTASPSLDTSSLAILAGSGGEQVYAVSVTVYKSPEYPIEASLDEWQKKIVSQQNANGYSVDNFQKVTINGSEGYRFSSHIKIAQISVSTTGYTFINGDKRIEITVLPEKSDRDPEINKIIESLRIL